MESQIRSKRTKAANSRIHQTVMSHLQTLNQIEAERKKSPSLKGSNSSKTAIAAPMILVDREDAGRSSYMEAAMRTGTFKMLDEPVKTPTPELKPPKQYMTTVNLLQAE